MPDTHLGKYTLHEDLGSGAFGTVYRATDGVGRTVAVKVLKPALVSDPGTVARFQQEARQAGELFHPRIATILDFDEAAGRIFFAMRYVAGESLDQALKRVGAFSFDQAATIFAETAEALDYAHARGLVHRDVKPANIILGPEGAVLTDFGLVRAATASGLSSSSTMIGTPAYMPPEVWEGLPATPQTDIYALGCVLYEMVTGTKLFGGDSAPVIMKKHFDPLVLPETWPKGVPPGFSEYLMRLLNPQPDRRPGSMALCVTDLSALSGGYSAVTPDNANMAPTAPWLSSGSVVNLSPTPISVSLQPVREPPVVSAPRMRRPAAYLLAGIGLLALLAAGWFFGKSIFAAPTATLTLTPAPTVTLASTATVRPIPSPTIKPSPTIVPSASFTPSREPSQTPTPMPTALPTSKLRDLAVSLAGYGNDDLQQLFPGMATGDLDFGGVRFSIPSSNNKVTTRCALHPELPAAIEIPVGDIARPEVVFVLINAGSTAGNSVGQTIGGIQANFADGERQYYGLTLGFNIREWRIDAPGTVGTASSANLVEVHRRASDAGDIGVIDRLALIIPKEYQQSILSSITFFDSSQELLGNEDPCFFILGLTVRARP